MDASAANERLQGFGSEVEQYLEDNFRTLEKKRLRGIVAGSKEENEPMSNNCKMVIAIPAHHEEKHLLKTLKHYAQQAGLGTEECPEFEVIVYVNGVTGVDLKESKAYRDTIEAKRRFPQLKIVLASAHYQKSGVKIGAIRRDSIGLALQRALDNDSVDIENLIVVTHDADLKGLDSDYVEEVTGEFERDPNLGGLTGFVDYPYEDFYSDHLFLTLQRFNDIMDTIKRYKKDYMIMRGGNSAFRVRDYVRAGGHVRSRLSENRPIYNQIKKRDPEALAFSRTAKIVTSARRQILAMYHGTPMNERYLKFGEEGDVAEHYQKAADELIVPDKSTKVTSPDFIKLLENELNVEYFKSVEMTSASEEDIQKRFVRAAFFSGFKIEFIQDEESPTGERLKVLDIGKLKENIMEKFNHF